MAIPDEAAFLHSDVEAGTRSVGRSRTNICWGQCKFWLVAFVAMVLIGVSYFERNFILLVIAAWSFIFVFPLVHVLIQQVAGFNDVQEEVKYKLSGNVVKLESREKLTFAGTNLLNRDLWYTENMDTNWYQAGAFSFAFIIAKAVLNMYSIMSTAIKRNPLKMESQEPNYVGSTWVFGIESPYFLFLIMRFSFTALRLRHGGTLSGRMVQLSGLLKSLGRFSALNLLEFIRIDDFIYQDKMEQLMSLLGGVIGFMAFRCKVADLVFVVDMHIYEWTLWQWLSAMALINNMLSITDMKQNMISAALKAKHYRNDRWLQAVEDHLLSPMLSEVLEEKDVIWSHRRVFRRLVTMGPDDVNRLIEDLGIEHESQSHPYDRKKIPKLISNCGWNWQLTNVVGVVQLKLFDALAEVESISYQGPANPPQQGKVIMAAEAQAEAEKKAEKERRKAAQAQAEAEKKAEEERKMMEQKTKLTEDDKNVAFNLYRQDVQVERETMSIRLTQMYEEKGKAEQDKENLQRQLTESQNELAELQRQLTASQHELDQNKQFINKLLDDMTTPAGS